MVPLRRITQPTLDVLAVLVEATITGTELHGWVIMKAVGRSGPTVYGVLDRLEDHGWVEARWDDDVEPGRPRRRYYRLTADSLPAARTLVSARDPARRAIRLRPGTA